MNKDTLPEEYQGAPESLPDWAQLPTGGPEEFGVDGPGTVQGNPSPKDYTILKKRVWQRQEMFLESYRQCGKIGQAAKAVGLTRWGVVYWQKNDIFGFKQRLDAAYADYCENKIEQLMDDRLEDPQGNRGSDVLLMFKAKAEMPHKYREEVKVVGIEASRQMMDKLRELATKERAQQAELESTEAKALEAPAVTAVFRDITPRQETRSETLSQGAGPGQPSQGPEPEPRVSPRDRRAAQVKADRAARREATRRITRR
jgi:hypothetical protein